MALLFVPVSAAGLADWARTGVLAGRHAAFTAGRGLLEAFGLAEGEEAEHVALLAASVASLAATGRRLVAVAEAGPLPAPDGDPDFGEVRTAELPYAAVQSLFADEPGAPGVEAAATAASGKDLAEAWELPEVVSLLETADLLWHGPGEWDSLG